MRFLSPFIQASLLLYALAVRETTSQDRFLALRALSVPLNLDDTSFNDLTSTPRDFAVAVLLTALEPRFGCSVCQEFEPEWSLLTKSWIKGDMDVESRIIFANLDFRNGKATFQSLMLQTAPVLLLFHPTFGSNAKGVYIQPKRFDLSTGPHSAEDIHTWITRNLPESSHRPFIRPISYVRMIVITTTIAGFATLITVTTPYVYAIVENRNIWAAFSLIVLLLFTSGHMFNRIRRVPYLAGDGKGGVSYLANGFQNQFGLETQIVAAIYGVLSFGTISLALRVPRITDSSFQQAAVLFWSSLLFLTYSCLISVFRIKNSGYPFYIPPF